MNFYEHYSWWLGGIASIVLATFGLLFNTISVYILCDRRLTSSFFNTMLACLAVVDNSFLFIRICVTMVMQFMELSPTPSEGIHLSVFIYLLHPAQSFFMTCSIYITIELAWERYTSISNPHLHHLRQMQSKGFRTFLYIMPVVMLSTIFNIPKLFERQVVETKSKVVSLQDSSWTNELGFNRSTFKQIRRELSLLSFNDKNIFLANRSSSIVFQVLLNTQNDGRLFLLLLILPLFM